MLSTPTVSPTRRMTSRKAPAHYRGCPSETSSENHIKISFCAGTIWDRQCRSCALCAKPRGQGFTCPRDAVDSHHYHMWSGPPFGVMLICCNSRCARLNLKARNRFGNELMPWKIAWLALIPQPQVF